MQSTLDEVCGASLPQAALAALAELRRFPDVAVLLAGERAWVRWQVGNEAVLRRVLALPGVDLYAQREGLWYRAGCSLPVFGAPLDHEAQPLHQVLFPSAARVQLAPDLHLRSEPLRLVRDDQARETTGMLCDLAELVPWVEMATSAQLRDIQGARLDELVMLLGRKLPLLPRGERLWGGRVLAPLGYRPEPALPESALWKALKLDNEEVLVVRTCGAEVIPRTAFKPLTRAGLRLALRERT